MNESSGIDRGAALRLLVAVVGRGVAGGVGFGARARAMTTKSAPSTRPNGRTPDKTPRISRTTYNLSPTDRTITTGYRARTMASSLRTAASRAARALGARAAVAPAQQQGPVAVAVRCMSGEYNPFTHSLDRLNTKKVRPRGLCTCVGGVGWMD